MKTVTVDIKDGKIIFDFNGFTGDSCKKESDAINALYGSMGVETDVEHSDKKTEREANVVAQGGRVGN